MEEDGTVRRLTDMSLTVLAWNIQNFGQSKLKAKGGGKYILGVVEDVVAETQASIVALMEVRSGRADYIGRRITKHLNKGGGKWEYQPSSKYGKGRWEQYLYLWNGATCKGVKFEDTFPDPNNAGKSLGFTSLIKDRPPYVGHFTYTAVPGAAAKDVAIAVMHAPGPNMRPELATQNLALITWNTLLTNHVACLVMGDFNIKESTQVTSKGSNGDTAFSPLVTTGGFEQLLKNDNGSSVVMPWVGMTLTDVVNEPYDQIFAWPAGGTTKFTKPTVHNLVEQCVNGGWLKPRLAALEAAATTKSVHGYRAVEDALKAYRTYVSDHLPVSVDVF